MKMHFEKPNDNENWLSYPEFVFAGFWIENIYIGKPKNRNNEVGFTIDWNPVYEFWDLQLMPILGNGINAQKTHWDDVENWLKENGYRYTRSDGDVWTWLDHVFIKGTSFWIYPKEVLCQTK